MAHQFSQRGKLAIEILDHLAFCERCQTTFPSFDGRTICGKCAKLIDKKTDNVVE